MSTKICKWTKEKGHRQEFQDLTRKSHQKTTQNISTSQIKRIQELAKPNENFAVIEEFEDRILLTRPAKLKNELDQREVKKLTPCIDYDKAHTAAELNPTSAVKPKSSYEGFPPPAEAKRKFYLQKEKPVLDHYDYTGSEVKNSKILSHPMYAEFPPIKDVQKEMEEINLRKKYLEEVKNKLFPLEEVDVRKKLNPFNEVIKGQENQMKEKAERKKEERKINAKWDKELLIDIMRAEKEEEKKQKLMIDNKHNMKKDLDEMCKIKQKLRERVSLIERKEFANIRATTKLYEAQKREEEMEKMRQKEELQRIQRKDIQDHKKFQQRIKDEEEMEHKRDLEFSIFKRAMGRKMRQHLKDKMEGKFNKKNFVIENNIYTPEL